MIFPKSLPRGGTIGICAPAGPVKREKLIRAVAAIESAGFHVKCSPSVFDSHGLFSAPDSIRRQELENLFADDGIDAVFCARGGSGCGRLLESLDTEAIARSRKPFLGFSDTTSLQLHLFKRHQFVSFAGPLAVEWDGMLSSATIQNAFSVLCGESDGNLLPTLSAENSESIEVIRGSGSVHGNLFPVNLTVLTTLIGTPFMPDLRGAILMIEDVSEPPYRVDRMMFHVKHSGILNQISALTAGYFGWPESSDRDQLHITLRDSCKEFDFPIVTGLPFGHGKVRMTLPFGAPVEMSISSGSFVLKSRTGVPVSTKI